MANGFSTKFGLRSLAATAAMLAAIAAVGIPAAASAEELSDQVAIDLAIHEESAPGDAEDAGAASADAEAPLESNDVSNEPAADAPLVTTLDAADLRTISGTIVFDEATTDEQKQSVSVGATQMGDDLPIEGLPVDPAKITYNAESGVYSINDLIPGTYKVGIQLVDEASGWWFSPGAEQTASWHSPSTGTLTGTDVDVADADAEDQTRYFDPAIGGLEITVWNKASNHYYPDTRKVIVTNTANGEQTEFVKGGSGGAGGLTRSNYSRALLAGTTVTVAVETEGVTVYHDGTATGTLDASKALHVTVPRFEGLNLGQIDVTPHIPATVPHADSLNASNRGELRVPATATSGDTLRIFVGKGYAGHLVYGWMFSDPVSLGAATVNGEGFVSLKLPITARGDHRIVVASYNGYALGWGNISIAPSGAPALANTGSSLPAPALAAVAGGLILTASAMLLVRRKQQQA